MSELEARIDEALVIARASEEGVREVGEMALDAARQARRAAEMAESASAAAAEAASAAGPAGPVADLIPPPAAGPAAAASSAPVPISGPPAGDGVDQQPPQEGKRPPREVVIDPLQRFNERADAVAARLRQLGERMPV